MCECAPLLLHESWEYSTDTSRILFNPTLDLRLRAKKQHRQYEYVMIWNATRSKGKSIEYKISFWMSTEVILNNSYSTDSSMRIQIRYFLQTVGKITYFRNDLFDLEFREALWHSIDIKSVLNYWNLIFMQISSITDFVEKKDLSSIASRAEMWLKFTKSILPTGKIKIL